MLLLVPVQSLQRWPVKRGHGVQELSWHDDPPSGTEHSKPRAVLENPENGLEEPDITRASGVREDFDVSGPMAIIRLVAVRVA